MNDRRGSGPGPQRPKLDKVRAPYNFVPLSDQVVQVPWAEQVQQDCPFEDGVCGRLELRLLSQGPLFVRGPDGEFFRTPDGKPAIPGSSIRGMLRAVVEIATFSRMERVNDHTYGVRDLQNPELYGRHMADIATAPNGSKQPMPLVSAGWLRCSDSRDQTEFPAYITPCSFAKIHYKLLLELARDRGVPTAQGPDNESGYHPGRPKQSSPKKYEAWGEASREVQVHVETLLLSNPPRRAPRLGSFGRVIGMGGSTTGTLVFTGQPNKWPADNKRPGGGNPKQHDFVFHSPIPDRRLPVPPEVFRAFEFVHSRAGEQHRIAVAPNEEWGYWKKNAFDQGGEVPVFFLLDDRGGVHAFGLAMMFRLAYEHSTLDAVREVQGEPVDGELDMAKAIFGHVPLEGVPRRGLHGGLKGRVSIGLGRLEGGSAEVLDDVQCVLGTPKASYYPSYVEQGDEPGAPPATDPKGRPRYRTYMDPGVRPRGWKRYVQRSGISSPEPPTRADGSRSENEKVSTPFKPLALAERAYFKMPVRVHNLRREELGALLWALDFGGNQAARHGFGMAKSLGYGSVTLQIDRHDLVAVDGKPLTDDDLDAARKAFTSFMEEQLAARPGGWAGSRQLHELLAMACPAEDDTDLRHMRIHDPEKRNEFTLAKKDGLALRPRGAGTWRGARRVGKVAVLGPERPEGWVRAPVSYLPGSGELSTTVGGASATATRDEARILIGSLAPDEVQRLKKKKVRTYEVRLDTIGRRRRIAAMRIPA
ncbi:MAG TPA: TIGR03986 family CRISPR-associated RAMP protein [Thermoanaerobaculia bacterium]